MNGDDETKETLKSFLDDEITDIENKLEQIRSRLKDAQLDDLQVEKEDKKERLKPLDAKDSELFFLRKEIGKTKERAMVLATKQNWWDRLKKWLRVQPVTVWLAAIPALIVIYFLYIFMLQVSSQPRIQEVLQTQIVQTVTAQALQMTPPSPPLTPMP